MLRKIEASNDEEKSTPKAPPPSVGIGFGNSSPKCKIAIAIIIRYHINSILRFFFILLSFRMYVKMFKDDSELEKND